MPTGPGMPDVVFDGPPSRLVTAAPRDLDSALLAGVTAKVRARLAGGADRTIGPQAVDWPQPAELAQGYSRQRRVAAPGRPPFFRAAPGLDTFHAPAPPPPFGLH